MKLRTALIALLASALGATSARADAIDGTLFYTTFTPVQLAVGTPFFNVWSVDFDYDGLATFNLSNHTGIALTADDTGAEGADGIVFDPFTGNLLVGGQNTGLVFSVNPGNGAFSSVDANAGPGGAFHLSVDPDVPRVFAAGIPGDLGEVPLNPFGADGTFHDVTMSGGGDFAVDTLSWVPGGATWFTSSDFTGFPGAVGTIDLTTFVATPTIFPIEAHGMVFDPFTGHLITMGHDTIHQIDPNGNGGLGAVLFSREFDPNCQFDQGTVDGQGHLFVASNCGQLLFMDYSATGNIGDLSNFAVLPFLSVNLDDIAPLVGPGAPPVPEPTTMTLFGLVAVGAGLRRLQRRRATKV